MNALATIPRIARLARVAPPPPPSPSGGGTFFVVTGVLFAAMFVLLAISVVSAIAVIRTSL